MPTSDARRSCGKVAAVRLLFWFADRSNEVSAFRSAFRATIIPGSGTTLGNLIDTFVQIVPHAGDDFIGKPDSRLGVEIPYLINA